MANNLTPAQIAQIQQMWQQSMQGHVNPTDALAQSGGYNYVPQYQFSGDGSGAESGSGNSQYTGLAGYRTADGQAGNKNTAVDLYDPSGNSTGSAKWDMSSSWLDNPYLPFALVAAGMAPAVLGSMGAGAGAAAGNSFDGGILNSTVMNGVGGAGGAEGAAGAALGNSFDGGALNSAVMNGGAAGAAGGGAGTLGTMGTLSTAGMPALSAMPGEMATLGAAGAGAGLLGAGSALAPYLGLGATALGALAGSQGVKNETNSTKSMDPRMDALFYGDLAPRVQGLLAQQMNPQTLAGWQQIQNAGLGLLSQPVAGNGFAKLTGR
jgi:hypothetical protein